MNDIYYDYDKLLSRNGWIFAFIITERGLGKTFGAKVAMLKQFLKTGEQFIYVRRYKTELDSSLTTFWSDLQNNGMFEELKLGVSRNKLLTKFTCDGKVCGFAVPLSTSNILKSTAFPKVKYIVFDEFLLWSGGTYRYLKNEVNMFLDLFETVFRLRDGRAIFLGNSINTYANPFFAYFDLDLPFGSEFRSFNDGAILVQYAKNSVYRDVKKKTKFGQLISNTDYGKYAIDNHDIAVSSMFIAKRPEKAYFSALLIVNGFNVGVWIGRDGYLYLSEKYDPNTSLKFAFDFNDHTDRTIFTRFKENIHLKACVEAYKHGWLRFENEKVKGIMISALNKCISF